MPYMNSPTVGLGSHDSDTSRFSNHHSLLHTSDSASELGKFDSSSSGVGAVIPDSWALIAVDELLRRIRTLSNEMSFVLDGIGEVGLGEGRKPLRSSIPPGIGSRSSLFTVVSVLVYESQRRFLSWV